MKVCTKCKVEKSLQEFYPNKTSKSKYRSKCKFCEKEEKKSYIEQKRKINKRWDEANPEYYKNYYLAHKEEKKDYYKEYYENNKKEIVARSVNRRRESINLRLGNLLRTRIRAILKRKRIPKVGSPIKDLGCSVKELKEHLEKQFQEGMTWNNYGKSGWHVDHIKPLANFDLTNRDQFLKVCHYTNLQPLWAKDNLSKGKKSSV